jgi:hypothetical protein
MIPGPDLYKASVAKVNFFEMSVKYNAEYNGIAW